MGNKSGSTNSGARRASLLIFFSLLPSNVLYINCCIRYMHLHMYRYRHIRLKLDSSALSRPSIGHNTTHRVLQVRCKAPCAAGCARKWRPDAVPRGLCAQLGYGARAAELCRVLELRCRPRSHRQVECPLLPIAFDSLKCSPAKPATVSI